MVIQNEKYTFTHITVSLDPRDILQYLTTDRLLTFSL